MNRNILNIATRVISSLKLSLVFRCFSFLCLILSSKALVAQCNDLTYFTSTINSSSASSSFFGGYEGDNNIVAFGISDTVLGLSNLLYSSFESNGDHISSQFTIFFTQGDIKHDLYRSDFQKSHAVIPNPNGTGSIVALTVKSGTSLKVILAEISNDGNVVWGEFLNSVGDIVVRDLILTENNRVLALCYDEEVDRSKIIDIDLGSQSISFVGEVAGEGVSIVESPGYLHVDTKYSVITKAPIGGAEIVIHYLTIMFEPPLGIGLAISPTTDLISNFRPTDLLYNGASLLISGTYLENSILNSMLISVGDENFNGPNSWSKTFSVGDILGLQNDDFYINNLAISSNQFVFNAIADNSQTTTHQGMFFTTPLDASTISSSISYREGNLISPSGIPALQIESTAGFIHFGHKPDTLGYDSPTKPWINSINFNGGYDTLTCSSNRAVMVSDLDLVGFGTDVGSFPVTVPNIDIQSLTVSANVTQEYCYQECDKMCQVGIIQSVQCNVLTLLSAPFDFNPDSTLTYTWSSPDTDFEASVKDTTWVYNGDLSEIEICLEISDGNCVASTCETIQVSPPMPPYFEGCVKEISIDYESECSAFYNFQSAPVFDPCSADNFEVNCTRSDGLSFDNNYPIGTTIITCIATSITGLSDTCMTEVIVIDNIPPECTPLTVFATLNEFGQDTFLLGVLNRPGIDECSEVFYTNPQMLLPIDCNPPDGQIVQIEDESGNIAECFLSFNVSDPIAPTCTLINHFHSPNAGEDSVATQYVYEVMDNCQNPAVTFSIPEGTMVACGSDTDIVMYVEDNFGNKDSCNFTYTVPDCFDYIGSICGNVAEDLNCDGQISPDEFPLEGIDIALISNVDNDTILIIKTDSNGNFKVDSLPPSTFIVRPIKIDGIYQTVSPPSNEYIVTIDTFETIENLDFILFYDGPTTAIQIEQVCYQPGDTIEFNWIYNPCLPSANIMLYRSVCGNEMFFSEQSGIANNGSFEYIIPTDAPNQILEFALLGPANTDFERFNCIEINDLDIDFNFELIGCKEFQFTTTNNTYSSYQWSFGDAIGTEGNNNISHAYAANEIYNVCLTIKTELGCSREICKELLVDGDCDDCNITFENETFNCYEVGFTVNEENFETNLNYQWTVEGEFVSELREPFIDLGPGTFEVCLNGEDIICGDQFCRQFTFDTIYPELINCPLGQVDLYANDNCDPVKYNAGIMEGFYCHPGDANTPSIVFSRSDGKDINSAYDIGMTTVDASFTDLYEATTACSFIVSVSDTIPPTCNIKALINLGLDQSGQLILDPSMVDNGSFDNCGNIEITLSQTDFNCDDIGQQEVSLTISDGINETVCNAQINIEDKFLPTCSIEDTDIYVDGNGDFEVSLNTINLTTSDNCGLPLAEIIGAEDIICNDSITFDIGVLVTDIGGNTNECTGVINLLDTIPPECGTVTKEVTMTADLIDQSIVVTFDGDDFFDNCGISRIEVPNLFYACDLVGENIITVDVIDFRENSTPCNATIIVVDATQPICNIADLDIQATEENGAFVTFEGTATDPCDDDIEITYSMPSGVLYECGDYTITMTATDEYGNSSSCDFSLKVKDCEGCCLSETAFMDLTNQGFDAVAMLENGTNCILQIFPPALTDCQIITQIIWDDGTITNGQFPADLEFTHEYTDIGTYNICITMEETNSGNCFSNQVCKMIEITEDCGVITSVENVEKHKVTIYPNPTNGYLIFKSSMNIDEFQLYNSNGRLIEIKLYDNGLDISNLKAGIYLLRIRIGNQFITKKIVKID